MRLIFLGPPGAGKGTQAARLAEHFKLPHIATGDMLRRAAVAGTKLGLEAKRFMDAGDLVPDSVTNGLARERINDDDAQKGFILDGYPRNVEQAAELDRVLEEMGANIDRVLNFHVPREELILRLSGRRVCPICQTPYHIVTHPALVEGKCDLDGADLVQRKDDSEESVVRRLEVYESETKPLADFYSVRGTLIEIDAVGQPDTVFDRILGAVSG